MCFDITDSTLFCSLVNFIKMSHKTHSFSDVTSLSKKFIVLSDYKTFSHLVPNRNVRNGSDEQKQSTEDHCHSVTESLTTDKTARRKLIIASSLCMTFMIAEVIGGTLSNSLAIMTDAAHLLTDFASFMISLFSLYLASRPATKKMTFGWYRAEVVGALVSVLLIWVVTGILVYMAALRLVNADYAINANFMLITSGIGVVVNLIMALSLHQNSNSNEKQDYSDKNLLKLYVDESSLTELQMRSEETFNNQHEKININVRAAFIHVIGDLFQSVGVLIAAYIIYFKPTWKVADPICTFMFSVIVLTTTINILRDTMNVLMEGTPKSLDFDDVKDSLMKLNGVCLLHNLRIWSLTMSKTALSVHLAVEPNKDVQEVLKEAIRLLLLKYQITDATIQVETYVTKMNDCEKCQSPDK